jgi:hypothetical protein
MAVQGDLLLGHSASKSQFNDNSLLCWDLLQCFAYTDLLKSVLRGPRWIIDARQLVKRFPIA